MPNTTSVKRYKKTFTVRVKCPRCEEYRTEEWKSKPDMKEPRVACRKCQYAFGDDNVEQSDDYRGLSLRYNQTKTRKNKAA